MFKATLEPLGLATLMIIHAVLSTVEAVSFLPGAGFYKTGLTKAELIDYKRLDPYARTRQPRSLMISLFYPASPASCSPYQTPYMDPITAQFEDSKYAQDGVPEGTFESLALHLCHPHGPINGAKYPLVLFSPGMGNSRLLYSAMAQQLASTGYIVVTVDHPYDADIVTYPDNTTVLAANISDAQITADLYVRVQDMSFVLDQLFDSALFSTLIPSQSCCFDASRVGIYGHSLGGATAAQALLSDSRLVGGINLDGTFFGSVIEKGLVKPFMIFAHEGKNLTTDPSWTALWPNLRGFRREFILNGSTHGTFTDMAEAADLIGLRDDYPQAVAELLGTISGERASQIIAVYVSSFFDMILKGKSSELLDKPSKEYPEVTIGET